MLEAPVVRVVHTTEDGLRVVLILGRNARAVGRARREALVAEIRRP